MQEHVLLPLQKLFASVSLSVFLVAIKDEALNDCERHELQALLNIFHRDSAYYSLLVVMQVRNSQQLCNELDVALKKTATACRFQKEQN